MRKDDLLTKLRICLRFLTDLDFKDAQAMTCGKCGSTKIVKTAGKTYPLRGKTVKYKGKYTCLKCSAKCCEIQIWEQ